SKQTSGRCSRYRIGRPAGGLFVRPFQAAAPSSTPPRRKMAGATHVCEFVLTPPVTPGSTEREKLAQGLKGLRENISLAWVDMISKPMAAAERWELSKNIDRSLNSLMICNRDWISCPKQSSHLARG